MHQTNHRRYRAKGTLIANRGQTGLGFCRWTRRMLVLACLVALAPAHASQAVEPGADQTLHEITWIHESPSDVQRFVIYLSPTAGSVALARQIDVGKPGGSNSNTAQFFSALVPVGLGEYVAIAAIGRNGLQSVLSEWRQPQPTQPGQPLVIGP